jgi:small subunit ribosomal protein S3
MGHKVNPNGFRLGITTTWTSNWYAERSAYGDNLNKDIAVRKFLREKLAQANVSRIQIDRPAKSARVTIHTARPGIVIGKKGEDIEKLKQDVAKIMGLKADVVHVSVEEIRKPELDAKLIAESVAQQLERRIMFRRAMKRAVQNAMRLGAGGIKIQVSGRLNGAEIARVEWYREGRVPLHTLRALVDYNTAEAKTQYGIIGVKVWVFTGESFDTAKGADKKEETAAEAVAA